MSDPLDIHRDQQFGGSVADAVDQTATLWQALRAGDIHDRFAGSGSSLREH